MIITVTNLTANNAISTDIGLAQPGETISRLIESDELERISTQLVDLQARGLISYTVTEDPSIDDRFEYATKANLITQADAILWVDGTNGNDTWEGTSTRPLKTIQRAIDMVPLILDHDFTVKIRAGTYVETLHIAAPIPRRRKSLFFEGQDWTQFTPATGVASGTFTSNDSFNMFTLTGAGWTVNDLRGHMLKVTSGAKIGVYYPIVSNTATTMYIAYPVSTIGNASFEIWDPAVVISKTATETLSMYVTANHGQSPASATNTSSVSFSNIIFNYGVVANTKTVFTNVKVYSTGTCINQAYKSSETTINRSYLAMTGTAGITIYVYGSLAMNSVALDNINGTGNGGAGVYVRDGATVQSASDACNVINGFAGTNGTGIALNGSVTRFSNSKFLVVQGCKNGIKAMFGLAMMTNPSISNTIKILSCTADAMTTDHGGYFRFVSTNVQYGLPTILTIDGCGGTGINLQTSHNTIELGGASSISNCVGFGVNLGNTLGATYNNLRVGALVTMASNSTGDITLDGTTVTTLADLRLDADKTIVDATRFNRMAAD